MYFFLNPIYHTNKNILKEKRFFFLLFLECTGIEIEVPCLLVTRSSRINYMLKHA